MTMNEPQFNQWSEVCRSHELRASLFYRNHVPAGSSITLQSDEVCIVASEECPRLSSASSTLICVSDCNDDTTLMIECIGGLAGDDRAYWRIENQGREPVTLDQNLHLGMLYENGHAAKLGTECNQENSRELDSARKQIGPGESRTQAKKSNSTIVVFGTFFLLLLVLFDLILIAMHPSDYPIMMIGTNALFIGIAVGILVAALHSN